jgi:hypothetical protein
LVAAIRRTGGGIAADLSRGTGFLAAVCVETLVSRLTGALGLIVLGGGSFTVETTTFFVSASVLASTRPGFLAIIGASLISATVFVANSVSALFWTPSASAVDVAVDNVVLGAGTGSLGRVIVTLLITPFQGCQTYIPKPAPTTISSAGNAIHNKRARRTGAFGTELRS